MALVLLCTITFSFLFFYLLFYQEEPFEIKISFNNAQQVTYSFHRQTNNTFQHKPIRGGKIEIHQGSQLNTFTCSDSRPSTNVFETSNEVP